MKLKSIIACGMLLLGVGASTTSCEDMFTAENNLVETDFTPQDSVFHVMGIVQRMQVLAERTIYLGELRADLVNIDPIHSTTHLQELANNDAGSIEPYDYATQKGNIYNQPSDYYAVINNCNIFLSKADSLRKSEGTYFFKKEICAVKTFRAWCYLELAKVYGKVPFVTKPVLDAASAENIVNNESSKKDIAEITSYLIDDLAGYAYESQNGALRPGYNPDYFIPVRVMLGELYLWRGCATGNKQDFVDAVRMYHDYLAYPGEEKPTRNYVNRWFRSTMYENNGSYTSSATNKFNYTDGVTTLCAGIIPLDTIGYYGNYADVRNTFNATYKNGYYPAVTYSDRLRTLSQSQKYCYYYYISNTQNQKLYGSDDLSDYQKEMEKGDLRLVALFNITNNSNRYDASYNNVKTYNAKYCNGDNRISNDERQQRLPYYRLSTIYLHMAEALNRAGFPETAFAVLKNGITEKTLLNRNIISEIEFAKLGKIKSYGFSNRSANIPDSLNYSFLVWDNEKFVAPDLTERQEGSHLMTSTDQVGIHSFGSGDSEYNEYYVLPTDSSNYVFVEYPEAVTKPTEPVWDEELDADKTLYNAEMEIYNEDLEAYNAYEEAYAAAVKQDSINQVNLYEDAFEARQKYVAQMILDEMALENCFEGTRFYDIMRYQMIEAGGKAFVPGDVISMPAYMDADAEKYGTAPRTMVGKPWFLKLKR